MAGLAASYIDVDTFTVSGDLTATFNVGRRVKADCGVDGIKYGTVLSSSFSSVTTVNLSAASDNLTGNLTEVWFGIVGADDGSQSMPDHSHDGTEGAGGTLSNDNKIEEGNSSVEVVDSGTGAVIVTIDGNSEVDVTDAGVRLGGANARVSAILDEDDMTSDSATALVTQQSIKAFVEQKDAWSGINLFDNAAMQVATRNFAQNMEAFSMAGADRWFFDVRGKAEHKAEQGVIQPNISEDEYAGNIDEDWGCFNLQIGVNTPGGTLQAPDYAMFGQRIPKSKLIPLMQNDFTISFYMRSSLTGTFCLSLRNAGASSENLADYYHSINHDSQVELGGSFYNSLGQTIRTDSLNRGTLTKATFYLRKVLSPTGTAIAELYEVDENEYTSLPTGSAVATSGTFDVSTLTTSFAEIDFTFTDNYEFIPNKFYAIVVTYTGGDGTNYVEVGTDISGSHNGQFVRETGGWSSDATRDCVFYYYETSIAPDRYYIAEFDINSSLTWEYKEINIPKIDPSIGTWGLGLASNIGDAGDNDELGLIIGICQYAGTGWNGGTADAWTTGNQIATTNQIYTSDQTSGRQIRFYQPKLEIGDVATPFYIQSHDEQHAIAMRHYQTFRTIGTEILCMGETLTTTTSRFVLPLIAKRGIPSLSLGKINDSADAGYDVITQGGTYAVSKIDVYSATRNTIVLDVTHATVPAANFVAYLAGDGSARQIDIDALI